MTERQSPLADRLIENVVREYARTHREARTWQGRDFARYVALRRARHVLRMVLGVELAAPALRLERTGWVT